MHNIHKAPPSRLESSAFSVFLATIILAPLAFWGSPYIAIATVKTIVIAAGTLVSAILYGLLALREKRLVMPPARLLWASGLLALATAVSAFASGHAWKSFFGQGFEIDAASFILLLLLAGATAAAVVYRRAERVAIVYAGLVGSFLVLWIFQAVRLATGGRFLSLGILSSATSTVFGDWYSLAGFAMLICILALSAIFFLPLSRRMRAGYWILGALAFIAALLINSVWVWEASAVVFLGFAIIATASRAKGAQPESPKQKLKLFFRRLAWLPAIAFIVAAILAWKGGSIIGPTIVRLNAVYTQPTLPWQLTVDVAAGAVKDAPILGAGPNRFMQAYLAHKPAAVNQTDAWSIEFTSGFGLLPTFLVTTGILGALLWLVFFIVLGVIAVRVLPKLSQEYDPWARFAVASSFAASAFLWVLSMVSSPSHALFFLAFVMTGVWIGACMAYGYLAPKEVAGAGASSMSRAFAPVMIALVAIGAVWLLFFAKDTAALGYFAGGVKQLSAANDPSKADSDFRRALALNPIDVYWQARAEAALAQARQTLSSVNSSSPAAAQQAAASTTLALGSQALSFANSAVASDPTNYYNFISEARVAQFAAGLKMPNGYQSAVQAYQSAIALNPGNPSLYLDLAQLQASQSDYDSAVKTLGAALQVKSNYIDAVYLLTQVESAKGNLADALTAAKFAVSLNSSSPTLYFELGLLQYENADYSGSAATLAQAIQLQPDYANAQYFLGLAYARLGRTADAIAVFQKLAAANPDNQEVALILADLKAGKSPFAAADASTSAAQAAPDKSPNLPIPSGKKTR